MNVFSSSLIKNNKILLGIFLCLIISNLLLFGIYLFKAGHLGVPVSRQVMTKTNDTLYVWASLITNHNPKVIDMMSSAAQKKIFSVDKQPYVTQMLNNKFDTVVSDVTNVRSHGDGTITAEVSYKGLYTKYGYYMAEFQLLDRGPNNKYFLIQKITTVPIVFPKDEQISKLNVRFTSDGKVIISPNSINASKFIALNVDNMSSKYKLFVVMEKDKDPLLAKNILATIIVGPGKVETLAIADLPTGVYDLYDESEPITKLGTISLQ